MNEHVDVDSFNPTGKSIFAKVIAASRCNKGTSIVSQSLGRKQSHESLNAPQFPWVASAGRDRPALVEGIGKGGRPETLANSPFAIYLRKPPCLIESDCKDC